MWCLLWKGIKVYKDERGHMAKIAAIPIYTIKPSEVLQNPITFKLGMRHLGLTFYSGYTNDDPGLTLTYQCSAFECGQVLQSHLM